MISPFQSCCCTKSQYACLAGTNVYGIDVCWSCVVILTSQIILEVGGHCLAVEVGGVLDNYVRRIFS